MNIANAYDPNVPRPWRSRPLGSIIGILVKGGRTRPTKEETSRAKKGRARQKTDDESIVVIGRCIKNCIFTLRLWSHQVLRLSDGALLAQFWPLKRIKMKHIFDGGLLR